MFFALGPIIIYHAVAGPDGALVDGVGDDDMRHHGGPMLQSSEHVGMGVGDGWYMSARAPP